MQQQANNYILQQSKANVTYAINKNMIEKVKAEEKNDILPITACSNSSKQVQTLMIRKVTMFIFQTKQENIMKMRSKNYLRK